MKLAQATRSAGKIATRCEIHDRQGCAGDARWQKIGRLAIGMGLCLLVVAGRLQADESGANAAQARPAPADAQVPANEAATSSEDLHRLIAELDDPSFDVRETATERLVDAGENVVPPLFEAVESGSLEASVRALKVLKTIYVTQEDDAVRDRIEDGLVRLSASGSRSAAQRAAAILDRYYYPIVRPRALAAIRRLGGEIKFFDDRRVSVPGSNPIKKVQHVMLGRSWRGGDEGLRFVRRLKTLAMVYLISGNGVSEKAVADLQKALPDLRIQYRGAAYLGIAGGTHPLGCYVSGVQPHAAAEKGGLRPGDIIYRFGDEDVPDFDTLIELIAAKSPGDRVEMQLLRGPQGILILQRLMNGKQSDNKERIKKLRKELTVTLTVELGEWR